MNIINNTINEEKNSDDMFWKYWYSENDLCIETIRDIPFRDFEILQANMVDTKVFFILSNTNVPLKNKAK